MTLSAVCVHDCDCLTQAVTVTSARIREEGRKCKEMADAAQTDLDAAMPALNAAIEVSCRWPFSFSSNPF